MSHSWCRTQNRGCRACRSPPYKSYRSHSHPPGSSLLIKCNAQRTKTSNSYPLTHSRCRTGLCHRLWNSIKSTLHRCPMLVGIVCTRPRTWYSRRRTRHKWPRLCRYNWAGMPHSAGGQKNSLQDSTVALLSPLDCRERGARRYSKRYSSWLSLYN